MRVMLRSWWLAPLALALAACGSAAAANTAQATQAAASDASSGSTIEMTDAMRLMLGTLNLKDVGLQPEPSRPRNC